MRVLTYRDVAGTYRRHPESKFDDPNGDPCRPDTTGALVRAHVHASRRRYIGKEADQLDEVTAGLIQDLTEANTDYTATPSWQDSVRPYLQSTPTAQVVAALADHMGARAGSMAALTRLVQRARQGRLPREPVRTALADVARRPQEDVSPIR